MTDSIHQGNQQNWLRQYYFSRTIFSILWAVYTFIAARHSYFWASFLLILYPAWDAIANYIDAIRNGGFGRNRMQTVNIIVSTVTTLAVILAINSSINDVIRIFGCWAILSGLLQLGAAVQRWKNYRAQWSMILSGAQSTLAGAFFLFQSRTIEPPSVDNIVGYAAFGAFYFCISTVSLTVRQKREAQQPG
ncbi:DUF308 domain-containing protein [Klebsiella variicola]|uniref:DUF308 domain-containing protein n=1 Tax=Klebsiella variicola TaxID=244366 RepID=UPI0020B7B1AC|nr:DUF308 domain-containing protein [Klebsiella variicola]MCP3435422.1 DUF308 domain-containing protein [Klebsiella variicola]